MARINSFSTDWKCVHFSNEVASLCVKIDDETKSCQNYNKIVEIFSAEIN